MLTKSERTLSLNSCWTMLSIVAFLVIAPIAAGSSANAATFSFTQIDVPGAFYTAATGINDAGQIVGSFVDSTGIHGFLYTGGSFTQIDVPGAFATQAFGINDAGQIVGYFRTARVPPRLPLHRRQLHPNRRAGRNLYAALRHQRRGADRR